MNPRRRRHQRHRRAARKLRASVINRKWISVLGHLSREQKIDFYKRSAEVDEAG
jgi:hypothetical protein